MTVFERLREARTADEVRQVQARALAERPFAPARELAALRRGVRERLVQVASLSSGDDPLGAARTRPAAPKASFGARLSAAPRRKGARRTSAAAKAGGGIGTMLVGFVLLRIVSSLWNPSKPSSWTLPSEPANVTKARAGSLADVAGWDAARTEIDALRPDPLANRAKLRAIAARLGLTWIRIKTMLLVDAAHIDGPDRDRLRALEAAVGVPTSPGDVR